MREYRGDRGSSYGAGQGAAVRDFAKERTPEEIATEHAYRLRQEAESAAARTKNLPAIAQRDEWRTEQASLKQTYAELVEQLGKHAADAHAPEQAQRHHEATAHELGEIRAALANAKEPRAMPPVHGEEAIEPRIIDRTIRADDVLAWVAGLGSSQRRALADRVRRVQGSADRSDVFSVALANYLAATRIMSQFFGVAENPRRFNRTAYENARARANATSSATTNAAMDARPKAADPRAAEAHMSPAAEHRSAMDRALDATRLGQAHLAGLESALVPAYRRAVAAMDAAAVKALALQIVGGVARIVEAQAQVIRLVPQADTGPHAAMASTAETDPGAPDAAKLATQIAAKAQLDAAIAARVPQLAVQVSPQWFGDELVAGHAPESPPHVREVLVQLTYEAGLVVQLLEEADAIEALIQPVNKLRGTSEQATDSARSAAVDRLERWKNRPINFLFLVHVLTRRGLWQSMQGTKNAHGHSAAELERKVFAQSKETGTTADVGDLWDADEARATLGYSATDWKVTDDEVSRVFEMLAHAEPRARGELVKQLYRAGRLRALCEHLPWDLVKQLWESIADPDASRLLEPYWVGRGDGKSLGKRLDEQDHWYTTALNRFLDVATLGAKPRIDVSYDAREAGTITDDAYWSGVTKAVGRAAFVAAAAAATGGAAGELISGASEGIGLASSSLGRGVTAVASGATAGGFGNVAGHLVGDVYDQVLGGKDGFDPLSSYGQSFRQGATFGGLTAGVGLAASRFLPAGARSLAQAAAVAHPQLTRILEAARSVGVGIGVKVQSTVREFLDATGGPPGFRFAYAGVPEIPSRLASAPPTASVWIVVRPLRDLNAPMKMEGDDHGGALGEIDSVTPGEEIAAMFDELSTPEGYMHPAESDFAGEASRLGEGGPEVEALNVSSTKTKAGVVPAEGQVHTHQHHVFPKEPAYAKWFADRGIDVDEWCIDLTPTEHQAQHGGGNSMLARMVAKEIPEAEWSAGIMDRLFRVEFQKQRLAGDPHAKLTPEESLDVARQFMRDRKIDGYVFRRYER